MHNAQTSIQYTWYYPPYAMEDEMEKTKKNDTGKSLPKTQEKRN